MSIKPGCSKSLNVTFDLGEMSTKSLLKLYFGFCSLISVELVTLISGFCAFVGSDTEISRNVDLGDPNLAALMTQIDKTPWFFPFPEVLNDNLLFICIDVSFSESKDD